ncbi:MAG: hypothetical protein HQ582_29700 [Planctomycetes bacterium]|nr:hypothetical protein [Planctomycetota bacterium]
MNPTGKENGNVPNQLPHVYLIAPTSSQPRYHKRAAQLATLTDVTVLAFSRDYYGENAFPKGIPYVHLGHLHDRQYLRRIKRLIKAVATIRGNTIGNQSRIFYALSLDCLALAKLANIKRGFLEVGDLPNAGSPSRVTRLLENLLFKCIEGLVLTSQFFYDDFYRKRSLIPDSKVHVIDNKVTAELAAIRPGQKKRPPSDRIVIGLVGLLRYRRPIEMLLSFVRRNSADYIVECYGDGPLKPLLESAVCDCIRFHGSFRNPEQLPEIYDSIDLNFVVYDTSRTNVRLAIPNKLFESAFFGVPIVSCHGTALGRMADTMGIGKMIRTDDHEHFQKDMLSIDRKWLREKTACCFDIPSDQLIDNGRDILAGMLSSL